MMPLLRRWGWVFRLHLVRAMMAGLDMKKARRVRDCDVNGSVLWGLVFLNLFLGDECVISWVFCFSHVLYFFSHLFYDVVSDISSFLFLFTSSCFSRLHSMELGYTSISVSLPILLFSF